nr:AsmA family protein [Sulfitobacter sp. SK012]
MRWVLRIALGLGVVSIVLVALAWSILATPLFSDFRRSIVSDALSKQIGQPLLVTGDVSARVSRVSRVKASGVLIPSEDMEGVNLAELSSFEFDLNLLGLLDGKVDLNNLFIDGLKVSLLKDANGKSSWTENEEERSKASGPSETTEVDQAEEGGDQGNGLLDFLRTRTATFTNIQLLMDDETSGFEFDFELKNLSLEQLQDGTELKVISNGTVNGEPFSIDGNYPEGADFTTRATFSSIELSFDGEPTTTSEGGGFTGQLEIDVAGLGDLLDVLKLKGTLDGTAVMSAMLTNQAGTTSVSNLSTEVELGKGQSITAIGDIENLADMKNFNIELIARLFPENKPPQKANKLKELKLTGISTQIFSKNGSLEFDELLMKTNAFQQGLDEVGPVSIGSIRRTDEGYLALEKISLQAGPRDAPILIARGNVLNLLEFKQLELVGEISAPASLVLSSLGEDVADAFGGIEAEFSVDDAQGSLSLVGLTAKAVNTDVWAMDANVRVGDVTTLNGMEVDLDLDIADGAQFLSALKLKPVDAGPLKLSASIRGEDGFVNAELGLGAGTSELTGTLATSEANGRPKIDAKIISEKLSLNDLKNALAGVTELGKISDAGGPEDEQNAAADEIELQPLVLPKKGDSPADFVDLETFLIETDIFAQIDFKEITGVEGLNSVSSELVSENGKARLGPLDVAFGGGSFNLQADMDLVESPNFVALTGTTQGWDIRKLLKAAGLNIEANGQLRGNVRVVGNRSSVEAFVNSMNGSASIVMSQGQIATSLLELAGLGVFPWLFSKEIRQGYTDVACVVAPVKISPGKVVFDSVVAETASVQLVARGTVDWKNDAIKIRAEPRPVGRPLARAAWPFDVTGKLSAPKFKLQVGGSRSKRVDGADKMPANRKSCKPDILQLK